MRTTPYLILIVLLSSFILAIDWQTDRMNFPPDESRMHNQTLINDGTTIITVNATIPTNFTLNSTDCTQVNSTYLSCNISANSTKHYLLQSPQNCTENTIYNSYLTGDINDSFTFICIPDNKITDCKVEYGHGDANYLSELYISDEPATIFNLVRIWNIGHYLSPNENACNANVQCRYENYPVRTYGRIELEHQTNYINGTFHWDTIEGGYWFRIGVVSQDLSGKNIGDFYNVSCGNLTYQFNHHQVIAETAKCNLEIRDKEPFTCTLTPHPVFTTRSIMTITNNEVYRTEELSFDRLLNNAYHTETLQQLYPGQSVSYLVDNNTQSVDMFYIPSWYLDSFNPSYYHQKIDCTPPNQPPTTTTIPDQSWPINTNNTAFDLDNYFSDPENDNLTYTYTNVTNITVIIDANNTVTFIPDINWTGTRYIIFYANDSYNNLTASNNITLNVYRCGDGTCDPGETCSNCPADCGTCPVPTGGGGGGGGRPRPTPTIEPEPVLEEGINLTLISYPQNLSLEKDRFTVFAEVKNTGDLPLSDVLIDPELPAGWSSAPINLGELQPNEKKIIEILIDNNLCGEGYLEISDLAGTIVARSGEIEDSEQINVNIDVGELVVLSDEEIYSEGDVMRLCIIYNNLGQDPKDKLEYEIDVIYTDQSHYIIDYLSSYSVSRDNFLVLIKDYALENLPVTEDYLIDVDLYGEGDLFSERYLIAKGNKTVFMNGIIEDRIHQFPNTIYNFKYENIEHTIKINEYEEEYLLITLYSDPADLYLTLLDEEKLDLDGDGTFDISLTYLGITEGKADLRLRILPKTPEHALLISEAYEIPFGGRTPKLYKPASVKAPTSDRFRAFVVRGLLRVIAAFVILVLAFFLMKGTALIFPGARVWYYNIKHQVIKFYEKNKNKMINLIMKKR